MQKMPYKHIAAHLKKTELACRLHFHQLSHGSHRRKRTSSVSSATSCSSAGQSPAYAMAIDHDAYSQSSRHSSPMSYSGSPHIRSASVAASPGRAQHKILLPKPRTLTPQGSPEPFNGLRINTEVAHQPKVVTSSGPLLPLTTVRTSLLLSWRKFGAMAPPVFVPLLRTHLPMAATCTTLPSSLRPFNTCRLLIASLPDTTAP
jgi:hypothetical protein